MPAIKGRLTGNHARHNANMRKLDDARRGEIRRLHGEGASGYSLAKRFGVSGNLIARIVSEDPCRSRT